MRPSPVAIVTLLLSGSLVPSGLMHAQQAHAPTGTVSGTVLCDDTQRPARFAQVVLFGVPSEVTPAAKSSSATPDAAQLSAAIKSTLGASFVQTQTGIDGQYTAANVAPGDYYLFATVSGYLQPTNMVRAAQEAGADLSKPIPGIPMVHVVADRPVHADINVTHGAAVAGTVLWDDGSPVTRAVVTVVSAKAASANAPNGPQDQLPPQFGMLAMTSVLNGMLGITDDLGHFRLAGLAPGDYLVKATLQTSSGFAMQSGMMNMKGLMADAPLIVFAPAAFHQADAKPVTLHTAEDRSDLEITFNLAGLHSVSGTIAAADTHRPINSGTVRLEDAQDKSFSRSASINADGTYTATFVPPGTYNLTIPDGADTEPAPKDISGKPGASFFASEHTLRSYEAGKLTIIVTDSDLTGQDLELTPSKTTRKDLDLNKILTPSN